MQRHATGRRCVNPIGIGGRGDPRFREGRRKGSAGAAQGEGQEETAQDPGLEIAPGRPMLSLSHPRPAQPADISGETP